MKTVIQRVKSASVTVDGQLISTISKGLLVLAAVGKEDTKADCEKMARDILKVKLWNDPTTDAKWKRNVVDIQGDILCVSQFTLLASTKKGNPSFHRSADPAKGKELYDHFIGKVRESYVGDRVKDGVFQAMMDVGLVNDGPVTIEIDTSPPKMGNPSGLGPPEPDDLTMKGKIQKTFELPASLLE
ncbi:putative aminoacyl-tRNA hydrolase [Polychaeton citri CBS 116435]|uniref:D-aminoacyl-tRNA deacylase n=1 Tax=Polychaeton citri CBS 116435 TaxID=1314669 RepID=A0A9P4UVK1_9PEZI|nr:putative aminoacyl-tRNA hydrolase [Polychaeton citri CBS 116435]